jgi:hypothetical protein
MNGRDTKEKGSEKEKFITGVLNLNFNPYEKF